jgi:hypothetical protein
MHLSLDCNDITDLVNDYVWTIIYFISLYHSFFLLKEISALLLQTTHSSRLMSGICELLLPYVLPLWGSIHIQNQKGTLIPFLQQVHS